MNKWLLSLIVIVSVFLCGFTVEEVKELQKMGFSNEQILELARAKTASAAVALPTAPATLGVPVTMPDLQVKMEDLKNKNSGLILVCASKEWAARGPGYLNFRIKYPTGKWGGLGRVNLLEYVMDGKVTPPVFEEIETCDPCDKTVIVAKQFPIITSRYLGEFVLGPGVYEFELERSFKMSENDNSSGGKMKRHKKFYQVEVKAGMVTVISYFWEENQRFGLDHVMNHNHHGFMESVTRPYGPLLHQIKVQHNK